MNIRGSIAEKLKKTIRYAIVFLFLAGVTIIPVSAQDPISGLNTAANTAYGSQIPLQNAATPEGFAAQIGKLAGIALSFIGILFFLLMIYGGFTWMIARGNDQEVTKAKEIIYGAVIGLVIVLSAYALTKYIGDALTAQ